MSDLVEFLLARIAEDETTAREGGRWDGGMEIAWRDVGGISESLVIGTDRVLAECDAKRRIVEACTPSDDLDQVLLSNFADPSVDAKVLSDVVPYAQVMMGAVQDQQLLVLQCMALAYAWHADYRPEWRP